MNRLASFLLVAAAAAASSCARAERTPPPASAPAPASAPTASAPPPSGGVNRRTPVVLAVERVAPAVVNISTERLVRNPYYGRSPLEDFLFGDQGPSERLVPNSLGSGVIVDPSGYVVTNEHVVAAASRITVTMIDGRKLEAEFVGSASEYDLALLRIAEPGEYPFVSVDFAEPLYPGETVIAIGNPFGLQSSVTTGVLSATHRRVESGGLNYTDFLQTDAAINPGNSGGALLTVNGDLIGINTQVDARGQNLGFAIPVARVRKVLDELVRYGEVRTVWLGLEAESLDLYDPSLARKLGVPEGRGMLVRQVHAESPAARGGVRAGDVLLALDGEPVRDHAEFRTALSRAQVGQDLEIVAWRGGGRESLRVRGEAFPVDRGAELAWRHLGLQVDRGTRRDGTQYVAIAQVRAGSRADRIGLSRGMAVLAVDDRKVARAEDFYAGVVRALARDSVMLVVADSRGTYRVPMPFE